VAGYTPARRLVRFGAFELDLRTAELRRLGLRVKLQEKPFQILAALLERPGEIVTREELKQRLWPRAYVDFDHSLGNAVNRLRGALDDSADQPRFVETLPKRGYRFIAPVQEVEPPDPVPTAVRTKRPWPSLLIATGAVLAAVVYFGWPQAGISPSPYGRVMLAVLPFQNLSGNPELEFVCDGLTEEIISQLGRSNPEQLGVIARTSSMLYKHLDKSVKEVGEELGVDYVLEGSLRSADDRWRITAQLIRTHDQTHLWAEDFNRPRGNIVGLQEDIAWAIFRRIKIKLSQAEEVRRANVRHVSPEAHEAYLRGRLLWYTRTSEGIKKSMAYFQRAIELEPEYGLAYAGLADAYTVLSSYALVSSRDVGPRAKAAALKAVELDDTSAAAHTALASVYDEFDWDFFAAQQEYKRAIELDPNYAVAHDWYSTVLIRMGMFAAAEAELRKGLELDPISVLLTGRLCGLLGITKTDEALAQCQNARELDPQHPTLSLHFAAVYYRARKTAEAVAEARRLVEMASENPSYKAWLGYYLAWAGQSEEAERILEELLALSDKEWVSAYAIATVYSGLGETDAAFEWLEKAFQARESWITYLIPDARIDPLREDPRYADLLRRVGLPVPNPSARSGPAAITTIAIAGCRRSGSYRLPGCPRVARLSRWTG
jgi:TolB-like protein/DNA-binding winged helix-turn-helix (wHTH) protein/Tfp pilus assembly protein PilF